MSETNDNADTVLDDNEDTVLDPVLFDDAGDTDTMLNHLDGASLSVEIEDPELGAVFKKGLEYLSGPFPRDEASPVGSDAPPELADGYTIESRAESMTVVTLGNAVRRGDLDMVQIGDAGVTDVVTGAETTTLSGTLREHTGGSLVHVADRVETTVGGRMSFSTMGEDSVLLGGPMTDTWAGGTFVLAVMSDDLCAGAGTRVTAPVDLWLNALTGMEERPGTTAADGVFAEAYGTLFEREYGSGTHAAGVAIFNGTIYQTQKTGFRPLMKVATGVRNLVPGSGAPASESPPPSPPSDPASVASTALAAGGIVMIGAAGVRTAANMSLSADNLADFVRAGRIAGDVDNAADLRHAADTAAQLEELRTAANQGGDLGDARRLDDVGEENPYGEHIGSVAIDEENPYDEIGGGANRGDSSSPDPYSTIDESNPNRGDPGGVENDYSQIDGSDPNAGNPGGTASPEGAPPVLPSANRMEDLARRGKTNLQVEWKKQYTEMFAEAIRIEKTDPARAEALRTAGAELQYAANAVRDGKDPRPNLEAAAKLLTENGFTEEAAKLNKASEAFTQFVESMRGLGSGGGLPPGVLSPPLHLLNEADVGRVQPTNMTLFTGDEMRQLTGVVTDVSPGQVDDLQVSGLRSVDADDHGRLDYDAIELRTDRFSGEEVTDNRTFGVHDGQIFKLPSRQGADAGDLDAMRHVDDPGSLNRGGDGSLSDDLRPLNQDGDQARRDRMRGRAPMPLPSTDDQLEMWKRLDEQRKLDSAYQKQVVTNWQRKIWMRQVQDSFNFMANRQVDAQWQMMGVGRQVFDVDDLLAKMKLLDVNDPDRIFYRNTLDAWDVASGAIDDSQNMFNVTQGDPRPALRAAAAHLDDIGYPDFADILHKLTQQYDNFYDEIKRITPDEWWPPPGILVPPSSTADTPRLPVITFTDVDLHGRLDYEKLRYNLPHVNPDTPPTAVFTPPPLPEPNLTRRGATWDLSVVGRVPDPDTGLHRTLGDYAEVTDLAAAGEAAGDVSRAVPTDTRAVVETIPADLNQWQQMNKSLLDQYYEHRTGSNWRAVLAYTDAIKDVRDDLVKGLIEFGGGAGDIATKGDTGDIYKALQNLLAEADEAGDTDAVRRIEAFLEAQDQKMYETMADLANRVDEFNAISAQGLDSHIDVDKVTDWLTDKMSDAQRRLGEALEAGDSEAAARLSDEMTYYDQLLKSVQEGKNPLADSSAQIAYLKQSGKNGNADAAAKADAYENFQQLFVDILSDPSYHRSAADMGDTTYAPVHSIRPDLGATPEELATPRTTDNIDSDVFVSRVGEEPDASPRGADGGDGYDARRDEINAKVGDGDYTQAPEEVIYTYADPGDIEIERRIHEVTTDDGFKRGDYDHFDPTPSRLEYNRETREIRRRTRPQRPLPSSLPTPDSHAWKSNPPIPHFDSEGKKIKKKVSFGDARQFTFRIEVDADEPERLSTVSEKMVPHRIGVDPPMTLRQFNVETAQGWQATRQPGFGRTAAVPGQFPFSVREQFVNALMKGGVDFTLVEQMNVNFVQARSKHFNSLPKRDWLKMWSLLGDLGRSIPSSNFSMPSLAAEYTSFAAEYTGKTMRAMDSKTLEKLLAVFGSGVALA